MKVGDLVRYRRWGDSKREPTYGLITEKKSTYSVKVFVFNSDDPWFLHDKFWDESHWEVLSESA